MPLGLSKTQLPPTRSDASKASNGTPRSCSALATAMPEEPAPMTAVRGELVHRGPRTGERVTHARQRSEGDACVKFARTVDTGRPGCQRCARPMRRLLTVALFLALAAPAASAQDYAGTALNIIPSGQYGGVPIHPGADVQAKMYDGLTPLFDQVTPADLTTYFKSETLRRRATRARARTEPAPRKGVTLVRDRFNVPHITGKTRDDVTWGAGWVLAEDRALLLAQGRYPARFAALDVPGIDAFSLVTGLKTGHGRPSRPSASSTASRPPRSSAAARRAARCCTTSTSTCRASTPG